MQDIPIELWKEHIFPYIYNYELVTSVARASKWLRCIIDTLEIPKGSCKEYGKSFIINMIRKYHNVSVNCVTWDVAFHDKSFVFSHIKSVKLTDVASMVEIRCALGHKFPAKLKTSYFTSEELRELIHMKIMKGIDTEIYAERVGRKNTTQEERDVMPWMSKPSGYKKAWQIISQAGEVNSQLLRDLDIDNSDETCATIGRIIDDTTTDKKMLFELLLAKPTLQYLVMKFPMHFIGHSIVNEQIMVTEWMILHGYSDYMRRGISNIVSDDVVDKYPKIVELINNSTMHQKEVYDKWLLDTNATDMWDRFRYIDDHVLSSYGIHDMPIDKAIDRMRYWSLRDCRVYRTSIRNDKMREAYEKRIQALKDLGPSGTEDPHEIMKVDYRIWGYTRCCVDRISDPDIVLKLLKSYPLAFYEILSRITAELRNNSEFMLSCIHRIGTKATKYASSTLRGSVDFIKSAIDASNGLAYTSGWLNIQSNCELKQYALEHAFDVDALEKRIRDVSGLDRDAGGDGDCGDDGSESESDDKPKPKKKQPPDSDDEE